MFFNKDPIHVFKSSELQNLANKYKPGYLLAKPWPHAVIDNFLPAKLANRLSEVFPKYDDEMWLDWRTRSIEHQPKKLGIGHAERFEGAHPVLHNIIYSMCSFPFLKCLETITGIRNLLPDPYLIGGGVHQILSGGHLDVHADFNYVPELGLYRRINVLLYLNKNWKSEYNGDLELWSDDPVCHVKSIEPIMNRLVIFSTTKNALHGHPKALNTPEHITRKSIALYYYTANADADELYDGNTDWVTFNGSRKN